MQKLREMQNPVDNLTMDAEMRKSYRKGWEDRKLHDSAIIEEAMRYSTNYKEFIAALQERMELLDQ